MLHVFIYCEEGRTSINFSSHHTNATHLENHHNRTLQPDNKSKYVLPFHNSWQLVYSDSKPWTQIRSFTNNQVKNGHSTETRPTWRRLINYPESIVKPRNTVPSGRGTARSTPRFSINVCRCLWKQDGLVVLITDTKAKITPPRALQRSLF